MGGLGDIEVSNKTAFVVLVSVAAALMMLFSNPKPAIPSVAHSAPAQAAMEPVLPAPSQQIPARGTPEAADYIANKQASSAKTMCLYMNGTGLLSDKCDISYWHSAITVVVDMTPTNARGLCSPIKEANEKLGLQFFGGWTMRIKSPYSGDNTIAVCDL